MNILWRRSASKKGAALMSVMCIMTFVIILGTVALTVTDAAHKNVIYQLKIQQAYYTAKSAAEKTASYISSHTADPSAADGTMEKMLYDVHTNYKATVDSGADVSWAPGVNYIAGLENTSDLGSYVVDIYPTINPNVFKLNARANYLGFEGKTAILIGPSTGGSGLEDALVALGSYASGGTPSYRGGIITSYTGELKSTSGTSVGGNICSLGTVNLYGDGGTVKGIYEDEFYKQDGSKTYLPEYRMVAAKNLILTQAWCLGSGDKVSIYEFYTHFAAENIVLDGMDCASTCNISNQAIEKGYDAMMIAKNNFYFGRSYDTEAGITINRKTQNVTVYSPIYVGNDFVIGNNENGKFTFKGDVYVAGDFIVQGATDVTFEGTVYVAGNVNDSQKGSNFKINKLVKNAGSNSTFVSKKEEFEKKYDDLQSIVQNVDNYDKWPFSDAEKKKMSEGKQYGTVTLVENKGSKEICYDNWINQSGTINAITQPTAASAGEQSLVFDTNIYSEEPVRSSDGVHITPGTPTGKYQDLYIKINSIPTSQLTFNWVARGEGAVYLYFDDSVKNFDALGCCGTYTAKPTGDISEENSYNEVSQHVSKIVFISDSDMNMKWASTSNDAAWQGSNNRLQELRCFIYLPNGKVTLGDNGSYLGAVVCNSVEANGGSETSRSARKAYVPLVDAKGKVVSLGGVSGTVNYDILLRSRSFS